MSLQVQQALETMSTEKELAELISAFNETTERLQSSHRRLQETVSSLQEELERKNEELARKERLASLGEMAAGIAHEIRNPLGGIDLYASLLERDLESDTGKLELVRKILAGVKQMDCIVSDMLAFAVHLAPSRCRSSLVSVLEEALSDAARAAREKEIAIIPRFDSSGVEVSLDPHLMQRVFTNILLNAVEALPRGGRVEVETRVDARKMRVVFRDDGPGIPAEIRSRIFNPFFTTKAKGTGLGLAIVHRIVEGHGGTIRVEDTPGGGATFVIELPMVQI